MDANDLQALRRLIQDVFAEPADRPRLILDLPNLQVARIIAVGNPNAFTVTAEIRNAGRAPSEPFNVEAKVEFPRTPDGVTREPVVLSERTEGLNVGEIRGVYLGMVRTPGAPYPSAIEVYTDPPTDEHPGGEIVESDITDNFLRVPVLVIGQAPTPQVPEPQPKPPGPPPREPPGPDSPSTPPSQSATPSTQSAEGTNPQQFRRETRQSSIAHPARLAEVVTVAILDAAWVLVTVVAALVLTIDDGADRRWWGAVGLASLLAVFTTVFLIRMANGRRTFIEASKHLADRLEDLPPGEIPDRLEKLAYSRRDAAQASGDLAIADRLTIALEGLR